MIAYHGKQEIKDFYLTRVRAHRAADELVKGVYWEDGKGCAVGCAVHSGNHAAYETEMGIPRVLAQLEDGIFENLPNELAMEWPERFLSSITIGANLSLVWHHWVVWLLSDAEYGTLRLCDEAGAEATKRVVALYQREIDGEIVSDKEWAAARVAAAWVARDAAATWVARDAAATAAKAAADAAAAAAKAAAAWVAAAWADAWAGHYGRMADKLIELLSAAQP